MPVVPEKLEGPGTLRFLEISRHRNRHEGDVITAPSREVGQAETAGGKLARSEWGSYDEQQ